MQGYNIICIFPGAYAMFTEDDNRSAEFISDDLDKIMGIYL